MSNRLKIISTIGPKSNNSITLKKLIKSGTSVFRLNGSHANLKWHEETIKLIRHTNSNIPICLIYLGLKLGFKN